MDEDLYITQPTGHEQLDDNGNPYVCKLKRALYGTKQAARLWNHKFRDFLLSQGWRQYESDPCIFTRTTSKYGKEVVAVYVDDIAHATSDPRAHKALFNACNREFPTTSQGELHWLLGVHITRNRPKRELAMSQAQAVTDFLAKHNTSTHTRDTPMAPDWKYGDQPPTTDKKRITMYQSEVGSLLYFAQLTRPDIAFAVGVLSRDLSRPNEQSFIALQHLKSYLLKTPTLGIKYVARQEIALEAYCDANWGSENHTKGRSTSGSLLFFGGGPVYWKSSLQNSVALASAESEFMSAFEASKACTHFRQFLTELGITLNGPTTILSDNTSAIAQSKNPVNTAKTRHMNLRYFYIRELVTAKQVLLQYVPTIDQVADIFTKPLDSKTFNNLARFIVHRV